MEKYAVIVAGGTGSRMQSNLPKQFLSLGGKPVLYYSISAFLHAFEDINIIVVLPAEQLSNGEKIINEHFPRRNIRLTTGGQARFHSVQKGLEKVPDACIVFIHDAVRCMVTTALIQRCYEGAIINGSAIPVIIPRDSLRLISDFGSEILDRYAVRIVQTPQAFNSTDLKKAFLQDYKPAFTDEATVAETAGMHIELIEGEENNLKITYPEDMAFAEVILKSRS